MSEQSITTFGGVNTYTNPLMGQQSLYPVPETQATGVTSYTNPVVGSDGQIIHCVNLVSEPYGAKNKRPGYISFLNNPDSQSVSNLFSWRKNDGTEPILYRASGSSLYFSRGGTENWTLCGGGTIADGARVGFTVLENVLAVCDGGTGVKTSTNGTSFVTAAAAPIATDLEQYQGRVWAIGTASSAFYSTVGTASDWVTDSSSLLIPGEGKLIKTFKASDRLFFDKNSNAQFRYDGTYLVDLATNLGPDSVKSVASVEDYWFWLNRKGIFMSNGGQAQLISNAIQHQIYNTVGSGIAGATFDTAPGAVYIYDYLLSVGTLTDDLVGETINDAIIKYDYQKNEFSNYQFAHPPVAWSAYKDAAGTPQLIFADSTGQCYQLRGTATSDAGEPITSSLQLIIHGNIPFLAKEWGYLEIITNTGCNAKVQAAFSDTFVVQNKNWVDIGDLKGGFNQFRFPANSRSRLCFLRIYEASGDSPWRLYGINYTFTAIKR